MIAVFVHRSERFAALGRILPAPTEHADGPYRVLRSDLSDQRLRVYLFEEGLESAYVAARLAVRRGATSLVPLLDVRTSQRLADAQGLALGSLYSVASIWNLTDNEELLRLLPDSASVLPVPLRTPDEPSWAPSGPKGLGVATFHDRHASRRLAKETFEATGAVFSDRHGAAFADVARECAVPLRPLALLTGIMAEAELRELSWLTEEELLSQQLLGLLAPQ